MLSLELGEEVSNLLCPCCGKPYKSVSGFIHKDDNAYSVYFATLQTGHEEIWILLTIHPTPTDFGMRIDEPEASSHANFKHLGIALSRAEALESRLRDQFFEVADFIVENDPAVNSYLRGKPVNISGRICKHEGVIH